MVTVKSLLSIYRKFLVTVKHRRSIYWKFLVTVKPLRSIYWKVLVIVEPLRSIYWKFLVTFMLLCLSIAACSYSMCALHSRCQSDNYLIAVILLHCLLQEFPLSSGYEQLKITLERPHNTPPHGAILNNEAIKNIIKEKKE